ELFSCHLDGLPGCFGRRHLEFLKRLLCAARDGDFGADYIKRGACGIRQSLESVFGHPAELSGSTCDHLIFKRQLTITWVVGASHTGVEMDLLKSRFNIGANLVLGFCHRLLSRFILPAVGSQVVST